MKFLFGVIAMVCVGVLMLFLFNQSIGYEEEEMRKKHMDSLLVMLNNKIEEITKVVLTSSVMLAKNPNIVSCLETIDRNECIEKMLDIKAAMAETALFENFKFHLHTKEFKSFIRLWEYEKHFDDDLSEFRFSFERLKKGKKPLKGIEVGRHGMFIRAIAPILKEGSYLGSIETAVGFESLTNYFKKEGIEFYVLMHQDQKNTANAIKYPSSLELDNYAIINRKTNGLGLIHSVNFQGTGYIQQGDHYILHTPIKDINGLHVGFFVLMWTESVSLSSFK